jgi:hypothetical protein
VPGDDLGREAAAEPDAPSAEPAPVEAEAADEPVTAEAEEAKPKKKTRRGTRGGRNRKKKPATTNGAEAATNGAEATNEAPADEPQSSNGDFDYVPMSEWADELEPNR